MTLQRDPRVAALLPEAQATINSVARSFALAARFLPRDVRDDINLLYLALRRLDDLVDLEAPSGSAQRADAQQRLAAIRTWINTGAIADAGGDELAIFVDLQRRTPALPTDAISAFLDGMESDLAGPVMESDADLDLYCYQVAGTVGRLMAALLGVRGGDDAQADHAARALGAAMQRTNILRDIDEDLANGRVYLPATSLRRVGLDPAAASGPTSLRDGDRRALYMAEIARADAEYEVGVAGIRHLLNGGRSIRVAGHLYREILRQIERDGFGLRRPHRPVVGRARKAAALLRAMRAA
ncbi:MAG: phytoene/squalene synthase family protein [Candidatus Aquidulcis sp.]|nr:MAG: phytoene/squalene synthase family protein [Candidatus Aquidulcis sp.]RLT58829.1 MAG: phytoene/squalene synthase family protein [Candidatus Aquidulcis sp.]